MTSTFTKWKLVLDATISEFRLALAALSFYFLWFGEVYTPATQAKHQDSITFTKHISKSLFQKPFLM